MSDETPEIKLNNFISIEEFTNNIKQLADKLNLEYIDAIIEYCKRNNIEVETAAEIIKKNVELKSLIQGEAKKLSLLK